MQISPVNNSLNVNFNSNETSKNDTKKIIKGLVTTGAVAALGYGAYRGKWIDKGLQKLSDNNLMKKYIYPNWEKDDLKFISMVGVASIILKDGLGCYLYVKQSLNNKEIPDDKRKFVAALDLANGGLMIATQILASLTISHKKVQAAIVKKLFGKKFSRSSTKALQAQLKKNDKFKDMTGEEFHKGNEAFKKQFTKGFGYLINLASATILAKRVIVPFIATPLADKTKAWMNRNNKPATVHKDTENTYKA